jgi:hemoglobin/transferrin/lactoferrin receptor protein
MDSYQPVKTFIVIGLLWPLVAIASEEPAKPAGDDLVLEEMTVVASRIGKAWIDSSGSVLQTTQEDLLRMGSQDLAGFAKYDPTVSLPFDFSSGDGAFAYGQSGYGSVNIRGIEGNRIAVELDGVRQAPQYVSTSFDMGSGDGAGGIGRDYFDPAMFEMIEVLKGGASALYGSDALGGVVAFTTPEPESFLKGKNFGGLLRAQYFSANESFASQAGGAVRSGNTAFMLLGAYREGHETENNGNVPPNPADFDSYSILLKAEHQLGDHTFRFAFETFERDTSIDAKSAAESPFVLFNDYVHNRQYLERQRASVRWEYAPKGGWIDNLQTHAYWQHSGSQSDSDSASKPLVIFGNPIPGTESTRQQSIRFDTDISGFSSIVRREFGDPEQLSHLILAGLDLSDETSENEFHRINSGTASNRISFAPTDTQRAGIFVQDEIKIRRNWTVTPGVRVDWQRIEPNPGTDYLDRLQSFGVSGYEAPKDYDNLALSPRLSVAWKPRETIQWYGTYAHGVRNPSAEELSMIFDHPPDGSTAVGTLTVPNPNLKEERSDAFELGMKAENKGGRVQVAAFYTRYSDFIENGALTGETDDSGRDIVTTVNRGKADIYGFEVGGILEAGHWWSEAEGWQLGLSTGKSIGINRTDDTWLNTIEPWKTVGSFGYEDPAGRFGARLTGIFTTKVTHVDETTNQGDFFRPPSWFTLDLGVFWKPTDTFTVHAGLNNLFDEKYYNWGSVRRGNGHLGGNATSERATAPGRNFSLSLTKTF